MMIELLNIDCMEYMAGLPDKSFDLAIVDPPYGSKNINGGYTSGKGGRKGAADQIDYNRFIWSCKSPDVEYFEQLIRVSKNQVIIAGDQFIQGTHQ